MLFMFTYSFMILTTEAVTRSCSVKMVFSKISHLWHRCFPMNFAKFKEHHFLQNTFAGCFCCNNTIQHSQGKKSINHILQHTSLQELVPTASNNKQYDGNLDSVKALHVKVFYISMREKCSNTEIFQVHIFLYTD